MPELGGEASPKIPGETPRPGEDRHAPDSAFFPRLLHKFRRAQGNAIARDSAWVMGAQVIGIFLGFLSSVLLARNLSVSDLGGFQVLLSYAAIGQIVGLPGMGLMINKACAKKHDFFIVPALKASMASSLAFMVVVAGVGAILIRYGQWPALGRNLMLVSLFLPLSGLEKYDSALVGKRLFPLSRKIGLASSALSLVIVSGLAWATHSLGWVVFGTLLMRVLTIVVGWHLLRGHLSRQEPDAAICSEYLKQGWSQNGYIFLGIVVNQLDRVILGTMDPRLLAIYYVGSLIPSRIRDNSKALFGVPVTHWATLPAREHYFRIRKHAAKILLCGIGATALIWAVIPFLLPMLYGDRYREAVPIALWLSLPIALNFYTLLILSADLLQKKGLYHNRHGLVRQIGYILLLFLLVPKLGYHGIIYALLTADVLGAIAAHVYFRRQLAAFQGDNGSKPLLDPP